MIKFLSSSSVIFDDGGEVSVVDFLVVIAACGVGNGPEDLDGNGNINVTDLLILIGA
tara:strand:+ start:195 stop:365 length:171 start_codon:yes stop_codon:yes gene_type:complete